MLDEMLGKVQLIQYGVNVFRPLPVSAPANPDANPLLPTRGGNTFVLNADCLRDYPNISPWIDGVALRRGDTLWAILNKRLSSGGLVRKTVSVDFPVLQDRRHCRTSIAGSDALLADILGGALTRAINQTLRSRNQREGSAAPDGDRDLTKAEVNEVVRIFEERTRERLSLLLFNSWRIQGLVNSIRAQMDEMLREGGEGGAVARKHAADVEALLSLAQETFIPGAVAVLKTKALGYNRSELEDFLSNLERYSASYREKLPTVEGQATPDEALSFLREKFGERGFELMAKGGEGVVFSDGAFVYKYFHHGIGNFRDGQLEFLQRACSTRQLGWAKRITPIERVVIEGSKVVFVSKFVKGHEYAGGKLPEIRELLRECRSAGIVLTNFSPKNVVVADDSFEFVDMGRSVEPLDEEGYREMCRRAYLVYRWPFRADLDELLRKAIRNDSLPEAFGFENFVASLRELGSHDLLDEPLLDLVGASNPKRVLDYGCGSGGVADKLAQRGIEVTAYDIDSTRFLRRPHAEKVKFVNRDGINRLKASGSVFDAVVCSLVLCSIGDPNDVRQVLGDLRKLVDAAGAVVVAICNPFAWQTKESETHVKETPPTARYSSHFAYTKTMKVTRASRTDFHRPLSWYRSAFRQAGLVVESLVESSGTDTQRIAPNGEFLLLRLRPTRIPERSDVSLLIKACAMEWRTIRKQVEHVVAQLESPRLFREKAVLVNSYEGPFARQYDSADTGALMRALASLVSEGVIDRVLEAPPDRRWAASLNRRWFGLDEVALRAENGQPVLATLHGFEQCAGEYVLHVDSDCLIGRPDPGFDYLQDMLEVFENDPDCVTVSLPVASRSRMAYTRGDGRAKWRTEVRCGLISKSRIEWVLPLPNSIGADGLLTLPWHRALDKRLQESRGQSLRGGGPGIFFVHVPNERKRDFNSWYNIMKAVEQGRLFDGQVGNVNLVGAVEDWLPKRSERYVVIVRGRNVPAAKLRRCFASLESQTDQDWGLLVVDAGSDNGMEEYMEEVVMWKYGTRATFYRNLSPALPVANIYFAVRRLCDNPKSVVLMPDADDALIRPDAVAYVKDVYAKGADLAVGGILRMDKAVFYSANFHNPRSARGGNVWQPLRTFKKLLFDRINPDDLKVNGEWVPHTEDWAFMLPMAEMAESSGPV